MKLSSLRHMTLVPVALMAAVLCAAGSERNSTSDDDAEFSELELARILRHSPLSAPPADPTNKVADDPRAAQLGQFLFFEPRLSGDGKLSCFSCHDPQMGFTDGKPVGEGISRGTRNSLSLINVANNRWFLWDGRADSLWAQAVQPIERPDELGSSRLQVAHLIDDDPPMKKAYEAIFGALPNLSDRKRFPEKGGPITDVDPAISAAWQSMRPEDQILVNRIFTNVAKAIAAYERRLASRQSPFDEFVEGVRSKDQTKQAAYSASARRGAKLFVGIGECRLCHSGPLFTDGEFHDIGVPPREGGPPRDAGRFEGLTQVLGNEFNAAGEFSDDRTGAAAQRLEFLANNAQNWGQFKTPSLRNVAVTAPYMHQGQFTTLPQVMEYYSTLQGALLNDHHKETILQPRNFTKGDTEDLIAFLESLTDMKLDPSLMKKPDSPGMDEEAGDVGAKAARRNPGAR